MPNEDFDPALYRWQDQTVEAIPKDMDNRDLGFVLEAAGDIFRELTGRQYPDGNYIGEKVGRIERTLAHPVDRAEVFASLSDEDQDRVDELAMAWRTVKPTSPRLIAVRNLNIALAEQAEQAVRFQLQRFKDWWSNPDFLKEIRRRPRYGGPIHVRRHVRRRILRHLENPPRSCLCHRSERVDRVRRRLVRRLGR